jgi:serine/threonine-protein kinase
MLALRRLFQRNTDYLTFRAVMEQPIPDIRRYRPDIPEPLAAVLMHALERDPAARFETARQLGSAVLDAMSPSRPWTQGEISDFVRSEFASELGKRSHQVANVVARTGVGRATMPLLAHQDEEPNDDNDDDFPAVETEISAAPAFVPQPAPPRAGVSQDFAVSGTPPPFGGETTGSAPSLQPLTQVPMPGTQVVVVKRSLLWPLLAVAMVAVAGGALFLVWKQMQQQQPAVVNITSTTTPMDAHVVEPPPAIDAAIASTDEPKPDAGAKITRRPPRRAADINEAVAEKKGELTACINDHAEAVPTGTFKAVVTLAASGQAKSVGFEPATVTATPLGACLRNVLMHASYPAAPADNFQFRVPLHIGPT